MTMRTARQPGDALVNGVGSTVSPGSNAGLDDDDQGIAGRLGTARGVPPLVGAGVAFGTALPQPSARRERRMAARQDMLHEVVEIRVQDRREFERYATLAWAVSRQVRA